MLSATHVARSRRELRSLGIVDGVGLLAFMAPGTRIAKVRSGSSNCYASGDVPQGTNWRGYRYVA
jgi:hypothetical protein